MAFLDRLVSDLIRSSTGFNARPFVKRIGAKNILLLGGAAVAGALAAEKMRESTAPVQDVPPPPPPPPRPLLFAIVRTLVAGAFADGALHAEEKKIIESRLAESGLDLDQVRQIDRDMENPPPPAELAKLVETSEDRELLYRFGALVVLADRDAAPVEREWLARLGSTLALDERRRAELETEIFSTT